MTCSAEAPRENVRLLNPQSSYNFGEEAIYRCKEGSTLDGPSVRRCQSSDGVTARLTGFNPLCTGKYHQTF